MLAQTKTRVYLIGGFHLAALADQPINGQFGRDVGGRWKSELLRDGLRPIIHELISLAAADPQILETPVE
jgi:hypothetical protein